MFSINNSFISSKFYGRAIDTSWHYMLECRKFNFQSNSLEINCNPKQVRAAGKRLARVESCKHRVFFVLRTAKKWIIKIHLKIVSSVYARMFISQNLLIEPMAFVENVAATLESEKNERTNFVEPINVCDSEWTNQIVLCIANFCCWFVFPSWTLPLFHLSTNSFMMCSNYSRKIANCFLFNSQFTFRSNYAVLPSATKTLDSWIVGIWGFLLIWKNIKIILGCELSRGNMKWFDFSHQLHAHEQVSGHWVARKTEV